MSNLAVSVRGLTKEYRIAHNREKHLRVTDAAWSALSGVFKKQGYETFKALDDVSFDVERGDVVGIIGRNGAGKSTLLKVLSRITEPTAGEIHVYGRVGSLLEVGTGFHPELTGRENIYLNGAILGMRKKEIDRQFDAIVDFAEIEKFLDTPVKRYSSGMYVRLAFSVAAHLNPEILIVDEVLAVGDAQFQQKCLGKMQDVSKQEGRTVLFVSHNMAAVRSLCGKALVLREGRLLAQLPSDTAIRLYQEDKWHVDSIADSVVTVTPGIEVKELTVQGSTSPDLEWSPGTRPLMVHILGTCHSLLRASLEITLTDIQGQPLAHFGEGHLNGESPLQDAGSFEWTAEIDLPSRLNEGNYLLTIDIADHNVQYWIRAESCVRLHCEGTPTATGQPLRYAERKGFLPLSGKVNRMNHILHKG